HLHRPRGKCGRKGNSRIGGCLFSLDVRSGSARHLRIALERSPAEPLRNRFARPLPNYVGLHYTAPPPFRAIGSALHWSTKRFPPGPRSTRIPTPRSDAQRPYRLIRPHHICAEPRPLCGFIGVRHIAVPALRSPGFSGAPKITAGL